MPGLVEHGWPLSADHWQKWRQILWYCFLLSRHLPSNTQPRILQDTDNKWQHVTKLWTHYNTQYTAAVLSPTPTLSVLTPLTRLGDSRWAARHTPAIPRTHCPAHCPSSALSFFKTVSQLFLVSQLVQTRELFAPRRKLKSSFFTKEKEVTQWCSW